jgi:serine/threonine protein kinase
MKNCSRKLSAKPDVLRLPDGSKLILRKGDGWKESYLEELLLPLMKGTIPAGAERVNSSTNSKVWKAGTSSQVFIKLFPPRGIKDRIFFRKSRARRAAEGGILLLQKGFHTPVLIAQGELVIRLCRAEDFLLTKGVEGSCNVYSYLEHFSVKGTSPEAIQEKRDFIRAFGNEIGRLHREGIFHGDLRPGNILVTQSDKSPVFYFIDNERNRYFSGGLPEYFRLKNLVQINMIISSGITFMDRLRFFKIYLTQNPELTLIANKLARRVHVKTKKRLSEKIPGIWEKSL